MLRPLINQLRIADVNPVGRLCKAVAAVQAVVESPLQIVAVDNAPDQCLVRVEIGVNHVKNMFSSTTISIG